MTIELLVPCTKRKQESGSPQLSFRTLYPATTVDLAKEWYSRATEVTDCRSMHELYAGVGWASSKSAYTSGRRLDVCRLFALSAGFGLLDEHDRVPIYSATFAPEEDQVSRRITDTGTPLERHRKWWRAINAARGLGETPICERLEPNSRCIVAVGVHYLQACSEDLARLARQRQPGGLLIVCVGMNFSRLDTALRRCLLPIDLRIERLLGGPRSTLNQRTLEWLFTTVVPQAGWERSALELYISKALASVPNLETPSRRKVTDREVADWIREKLAQNPSLIISRLRTQFRQNNTACEQGRFSRLVWSVRRSLREEHTP